MKSGIELIAAERQEQIEKHGRTILADTQWNGRCELKYGAIALLTEGTFSFPDNWEKSICKRMSEKPYKEKLIIAGALIAAEIDRLQNGND